jgi:hypothetical protein
VVSPPSRQTTPGGASGRPPPHTSQVPIPRIHPNIAGEIPTLLTSNSGGTSPQHASLRSERRRLAQIAFSPRQARPKAVVGLMYLASRTTGIPSAQLRALQELAPEWMELRSTTVTDDHPNFARFQTAFQIQRVPSLVLFHPEPGETLSQPDPPVLPSAYCVVDDPASLQDLGEPGNQVGNLIQMFAGVTPQEMDTTLRTRRFRMLVWEAAAHSGVPLAYLQDLKVRFGSVAGQMELSFDERGWPTDPNRPPPLSKM